MKIAACAICKNEEKNIPQWLLHTAGCDYRVVVDTGSTDNSVQLLKEAGVSVIEKLFEPFRFDMARNAVLDFVPKDTDWLVWPDFDEYYNKNWRNELERTTAAYPWVTRLTHNTFQLIDGMMREGAESGTVMESKIHKHGVYRWEKPVHEHLVWTGKDNEAVKHVSGIARYHLHKPSKERDLHYFEIAKRGLDENPRDEYLTWFVLKEYYYTLKNLKESKKYAERYLALTHANTDFRAIARAIVVKAEEGKQETADVIESGTHPTFPGSDYTFGTREKHITGSPIEGVMRSGFPSVAVRNMIFDLFKNNEDKAGIELAQVYLTHEPSAIPVVNELAGALYRTKRFQEAFSITEQLARQFPEDPGTAFNLAKCYHALKRPDDASKLLKYLCGKDPKNRDYALDYALYLSGEGKFDESETILRDIAQDGRTRFNLGWYEMRKGNFMEGFALRDHGRREHLWGSEHVTSMPKDKRYAGESLAGKTLLLFNEGGLGDEMIFARFARTVKDRGAKYIIMGCSPDLVSVFRRSLEGIVNEVLPLADAKKRSYDF